MIAKVGFVGPQIGFYAFIAPRWLKIGPIWDQEVPRGLKTAPRAFEIAPRWPKTASMGPRCRKAPIACDALEAL